MYGQFLAIQGLRIRKEEIYRCNRLEFIRLFGDARRYDIATTRIDIAPGMNFA